MGTVKKGKADRKIWELLRRERQRRREEEGAVITAASLPISSKVVKGVNNSKRIYEIEKDV